MTPLFKKLNLKEHTQIVVIDAPVEFEAELSALGELSAVDVLRSAAGVSRVEFALVFVRTQDAIDKHAREIVAKVPGDPILWFAYPKASSKRYSCDFNRDSGWDTLGELGFEGVRQVAIDDDWSALRFRRVEHIKSLTREKNHAITADGKRRASSPSEQGDNQ